MNRWMEKNKIKDVFLITYTYLYLGRQKQLEAGDQQAGGKPYH